MLRNDGQTCATPTLAGRLAPASDSVCSADQYRVMSEKLEARSRHSTKCTALTGKNGEPTAPASCGTNSNKSTNRSGCRYGSGRSKIPWIMA